MPYAYTACSMSSFASTACILEIRLVISIFPSLIDTDLTINHAVLFDIQSRVTV